MSKVILFNGGKGCGKTNAIDYLKNKIFHLEDVGCKVHLHNLTRQFFCVPEEDYWNIYENRVLKESPSRFFKISRSALVKLNDVIDCIERLKECSLLYNNKFVFLSIREAMIFVSEVLCKPTFGKEYFGKARASLIDKSSDAVYYDDSAGFVEELAPLTEKIPQEDILLVRIQGRGDFEGDSRGYIPDGIIENTVDIWNTKDLYSYLEEIEKTVNNFLK